MFPYSIRYGGKRRFFFFLFPLVLAALAGIVMLLWNAILPEVAHVERINYLQALGILILSKILFGFRFGPGGRSFGSRSNVREKWMSMTEEERQKFREEWRRRCGR